jgi:hypothetical protein
MRRFEDWDTRLEAYISANRDRAFIYGQWDCFQFVRGAVQAMTGADIAARFKPYGSKLGYLRQMYRFCDSILLDHFADVLLGSVARAEDAAFAHRGDVVFTRDGAFGIVGLNGRSIMMLAETGMTWRPMSIVYMAWEI